MTLDGPRADGAPCGVVGSRGDGRIYKRKGSSRYWIQYSIRGRQYREPAGKTPAAARNKLRQRLREAGTERFGGPAAERVTVDHLADALLVHLKNQGRVSVDKIHCHLKPVRVFFAGRPAMDVTTAALERYQRERLDAKKASATVNREVHALRRAFNVAARQTPPLFPKHLVPYFPSLPVDNVRCGFFERAEVEALLQNVEDDGIRDFIAWGFRTGMREGEIARLTWTCWTAPARRGSSGSLPRSRKTARAAPWDSRAMCERSSSAVCGRDVSKHRCSSTASARASPGSHHRLLGHLAECPPGREAARRKALPRPQALSQSGR